MTRSIIFGAALALLFAGSICGATQNIRDASCQSHYDNQKDIGSCNIDSDCPENAGCVHGKCKCSDGYFFTVDASGGYCSLTEAHCIGSGHYWSREKSDCSCSFGCLQCNQGHACGYRQCAASHKAKCRQPHQHCLDNRCCVCDDGYAWDRSVQACAPTCKTSADCVAYGRATCNANSLTCRCDVGSAWDVAITTCTTHEATTPKATTHRATTHKPTTPHKTSAASTVAATKPPTQGSCGYSLYTGSGASSDRIVGGTNALLHEVPWIVRLDLFGPDFPPNSTYAYCGGVVISENYVLTTGSCLHYAAGQSIAGFIAYFSDYNRTTLTNPGEFSMVIPLSNAFINPDFNSATYDYDFGLLKLPSPLDFSTWNVQPVCLPAACPNDLGNYCRPGSVATISGWGQTNQLASTEPNVLQIATIGILNNTSCSKAYAGINPVTPEEICAESPGVGGCFGDGGGPLTELNFQSAAYLCGLDSWSVGCAEPGYPGVYSRVCKAIDWIDSIVSPSTTVTPATVPPPTGSCGLSKYSGLAADRIVGGTSALPHEIPWIVRLSLIGPNQDPTNAWGEGTVISENYVLIGAGAVYYSDLFPNVTGFRLYFSDYNRTIFDNPGEFSMDVPLANAFIHPDFNVTVAEYDFALLKLPTPLDFSTWNVQPVCLPAACPNDFGNSCPPGSTAMVSGWGVTNATSRDKSDILEVATLDILNNTACSNDYKGYMYPVTDVEICGDVPNGGVGTCFGDGGGPLTELNSQSAATLCGLASWSKGCAQVQYPSVFARVCKVIDWIQATIMTLPTPPTTLPPPVGSCGLSLYTGSGASSVRIVGGTNTHLHEIPWMVRLYPYGPDFSPNATYAYCGGVVISENYVLTTGSCLHYTAGQSIAGFTAYFSDYDQTTVTNPGEFSMVVPLSSVFINPNFNSATFDYDFGLLKLPSPLDFSTWNVQPVCLPAACPNDLGNYCPPGAAATISGWGLTNQLSSSEPNILQIATIDILNSTACSKDYAGVNPVTPEEICAQYPGIGGCFGDGGGPLTELNSQSAATLCGLDSWSVGCARPGYPGVYARVCKAIDWIQATMAHH